MNKPSKIISGGMLTNSLAEFANRVVLIVSDKDIVYRMVRDCLKDCGMLRVSVVPGRKATWESVSATVPDLVIVDVDIDSNDALDLIAEIRAHEFMFKTPVIALTGHAMKDHILKIARAGADDVLVKPFPLRKLRDRVIVAFSKNDSKNDE